MGSGKRGSAHNSTRASVVVTLSPCFQVLCRCTISLRCASSIKFNHSNNTRVWESKTMGFKYLVENDTSNSKQIVQRHYSYSRANPTREEGVPIIPDYNVIHSKRTKVSRSDIATKSISYANHFIPIRRNSCSAGCLAFTTATRSGYTTEASRSCSVFPLYSPSFEKSK